MAISLGVSFGTTAAWRQRDVDAKASGANHDCLGQAGVYPWVAVVGYLGFYAFAPRQ
jgi:hypothetical protein